MKVNKMLNKIPFLNIYLSTVVISPIAFGSVSCYYGMKDNLRKDNLIISTLGGTYVGFLFGALSPICIPIITTSLSIYYIGNKYNNYINKQEIESKDDRN